MKVLIFTTTLQGARTLLLALAVGMLAFQALISYTYKSFSGVMGQFLQDMPKEFTAFIKIQAGVPMGDDPNAYLTLGYYHPIFLLLGSAAAITLGAQALAGEVDRGTILYLLARPLPRWQVVLSKGAVILPATALLTSAAVAGTAVGTVLLGINLDVGRFVLVALNAWMLFSAIGTVALLCSALAGSTGQAAGWASSFAIASFIVDFLAELWEPARRIRPFSLFAHFDPSRIITSGSLRADDLAILIGVTVTVSLLAAFVFSRRDLRV